VHTEFERKGIKSSEWHYYISSRNLTAEGLLHHARMEWCMEDKNIQQNLNMLRKLAVNLIKRHKESSESKRAISKIMFDCLLDPSHICGIFKN